jgi:hypothetical protein
MAPWDDGTGTLKSSGCEQDAAGLVCGVILLIDLMFVFSSVLVSHICRRGFSPRSPRLSLALSLLLRCVETTAKNPATYLFSCHWLSPRWASWRELVSPCALLSHVSRDNKAHPAPPQQVHPVCSTKSRTAEKKDQSCLGHWHRVPLPSSTQTRQQESPSTPGRSQMRRRPMVEGRQLLVDSPLGLLFPLTP